MDERLRRLLVPFASGVAYAVTVSKFVLGGDSGELAAVGANGGVAHPPGYPLFILWCRLWSWLPAETPAHRVGLATAIAGALAVFMLERACRAWGARPLAASLAAALFAFSPLAWRLSSEPEVFMLNALVALGIVTIAAPGTWAREDRRAIALAFLAGLGIANHHTIVLLAPLGLFAWGRAIRRTDRRAIAVAGSVGAFALGLVPYAYLLVASGSECAWGDTSTLAGVLHHFLRADYGTTQLASTSNKPEPLGQLAWLGHSFVESGIAFTLLIAAIMAGLRRRWSWDHAALVATLLIAGPVFATRFNLPPRGLMSLVVVRFHLLPLALASVLGSLGIDAIAEHVRSPLARRVTLGAVVAVLVARAALSGSEALAHRPPTIERYLRNVFAIVPPNSIVVAMGDDAVGGFEYMQCVLGERRDVVVITPPLLLGEWYGRRIDRELGFPVVHGVVKPGEDLPSLDGTMLTEQLVASGRPVFLTSWFVSNLDKAFPSYPVGPLIRLVRSPAEVPAPAALERENEEVFARMTLDDPPPLAHTWAGVRYLDYERPWRVLAQAFAQNGNFVEMKQSQARAVALEPREPASGP